MPTVQDFYNYLNEIAPFSTQMSFDNSGFLVGDPEQNVTRVAVCLDITHQTIAQAMELGAQLIISHHPVIFKAKKQLLKGDPAFELAKAGISAICAHTCLDCANEGVNDVLARKLGLQRVEPAGGENETALLRIGCISPMSGEEFAGYVANCLEGEEGSVRLYDSGKPIESVAVCGGSGGSFLSEVMEMGVDAYVTGEASHHDFIDAAMGGLTLIAAGHFETENPVVAELSVRLRRAFPECFIEALDQENPIQYV